MTRWRAEEIENWLPGYELGNCVDEGLRLGRLDGTAGTDGFSNCVDLGNPVVEGVVLGWLDGCTEAEV